MPRHIDLPPPPNNIQDKNNYAWANWFLSVFTRLGSGPLQIQGYSKASLPEASKYGNTDVVDPYSSLIFVRDDITGPLIAFSDGTSWRRVTDRAVVS